MKVDANASEPQQHEVAKPSTGGYQSAKDQDILKYEDVIEAEVVKLRGQGQFVPRSMIKTVLVGREVEAARARKANGGRKPSQEEADADRRLTKARGTGDRPRSDATGNKARMTDAQKRNERLRGKEI